MTTVERSREPPRITKNPPNQPLNSASPISHLGTISRICSSPNSWIILQATQETGTRTRTPAIHMSIPPRSNSCFFSFCSVSSIIRQPKPRPEITRLRKLGLFDEDTKILEVLNSRGKARKESKSTLCSSYILDYTRLPESHSPKLQFV